MERHIPGRGGKAPVIVAAAIALTGFAALIPSCLGEFFCFQQLVQRFFYAASNQFLNLTLDYFLVELYNVVGHGLPSPFECLCSNFILPETRRPCLLFCRLQFAQFYYTLSFTASRFACFCYFNTRILLCLYMFIWRAYFYSSLSCPHSSLHISSTKTLKYIILYVSCFYKDSSTNARK